LALPPVREAAPPWQVLIGPFAADHVEAELDHGAPLLLVPNDLERAESLAGQFEGRGGGLLSFSRDLLGSEDGEVCWYRYSDPRFDGLAAPEALLPLAPNLRLRDLELRPVVRLDSLIHSWANRDPALAALVAAGGGRVWLQSKQPLPIVAGVSRVVEVIGAFCWTPLGTPVDPPDGPAAAQRLAEWLEASGFHPAERRPVNTQCAAPSLVWLQDPLRRAAARQQQLEAEVAALRQQVAEGQQEAESLRQQMGVLQEGWEAQRQALQAEAALERAAQEAEAARLTAEGNALRQEVETLRRHLAVLQQGLETQRQALKAEAAAERAAREAEIVRLAQEGVVQRQALDSLQQELGAATALRPSLEAEIARLGQENGALREEAEGLRGGVEALRGEGEALREEREALREEVAALRGEVAALRAEGEALQAEGEVLREAAAALQQDRDTLQQDNGNLQRERDALRQERDALRQEKDTLRQETRTEIAAILALLDPVEALSPDPTAPAAP